MGIRVLLAEDDESKKDHIRSVITESMRDPEIDLSGSFQSALKKLISTTYGLVILDMTLPTFDKGELESAGKLRPLGGQELLDQMHRRDINVPVVVVTGYDILGSGDSAISLDTLRIDMKKKFPNQFRRAIFYSRAEEQWKLELKQALDSIFGSTS